MNPGEVSALGKLIALSGVPGGIGKRRCRRIVGRARLARKAEAKRRRRERWRHRRALRLQREEFDRAVELVRRGRRP